MAMTESHDLLIEYVRNGNESAFKELVVRYLDLVYSTALRKLGGDTPPGQGRCPNGVFAPGPESPPIVQERHAGRLAPSGDLQRGRKFRANRTSPPGARKTGSPN